MNYFTKDLSVIAKEILAALHSIKDRITSLRGDLQEHTHEITKANQAANEKQNVRPEVLTETHLPEGVEIRKSASDAKAEKKHQRHLLFVQWLTLIAVSIYAVVTYSMWKEMRAATDAANLTSKYARISTANAAQQFKIQNDQFQKNFTQTAQQTGFLRKSVELANLSSIHLDYFGVNILNQQHFNATLRVLPLGNRKVNSMILVAKWQFRRDIFRPSRAIISAMKQPIVDMYPNKADPVRVCPRPDYSVCEFYVEGNESPNAYSDFFSSKNGELYFWGKVQYIDDHGITQFETFCQYTSAREVQKTIEYPNRPEGWGFQNCLHSQ